MKKSKTLYKNEKTNTNSQVIDNSTNRNSIASSTSSDSYIDPHLLNQSLHNLEHQDDVNGKNYENYYNVIDYNTVTDDPKTTKKEQQNKCIIIFSASIVVFLLIVAIATGTLHFKQSTQKQFEKLSTKNESTEQFCVVEDNEDAMSEKTNRTKNFRMICRQEFVRNMTVGAFSAYRKFAWGRGELRPLNQSAYYYPENGQYPGLTIIDSMSTLWVMELKEEWTLGKNWIDTQFPNFVNLDSVVRVQEMVFDFLGGLLSAYALSGEQIFLNKAKEVYNALTPAAFSNVTGMLAFQFNPKGKRVNTTVNGTILPQIDHQKPEYNYLAFVGFQQPELIYATNLSMSKNRDNRSSDASFFLAKSKAYMLKNFDKRTIPVFFTELNVEFGGKQGISQELNELTLDFYYNALLSYTQLGKHGDTNLLMQYGKLMENAQKAGMFKILNGRLYLRMLQISPFLTLVLEHRMNRTDSTCRLGAMLALSSLKFSQLNNTEKAQKFLDLAINITDTCHYLANSTRTKLMAYQYNFDVLTDPLFRLE